MDTVKTRNRHGFLNMVVWILVFGSLWGVSEVALGGALKAAGFPYRSGLLTGIGMAILAMAMVVCKRPLVAVGVGAVAVLVGLLVVPVLHVSPACRANSSLALMLESGSLTLAASLVSRKTRDSVHARMAMGVGAALLASATFYSAGVRFVPCAYLLSFTLGSFVLREGLVWAAFSGILLPIGYAAGERFSKKAQTLRHRSVVYAGSTAVVAVCWGVSAMAIAAGL